MKPDILYGQLKNKKEMEILNNKLNLILSDLLSSNIKLGERLKSKLKVVNFLSNIEHRNRKYFKDFIVSSNRRTNCLKRGLRLNETIKQNDEKINKLVKQMGGDIILQNMDIILNEKKLLNENTEPETQIKLYNILSQIKKAIKPSLLKKEEEKSKGIKALTVEEMEKTKNYLGNKITKEQNNIYNNINSYKNKFNDIFKNNKSKKIDEIKKDYNKIFQTFNFQKDIKFINYKKPKAKPIKDKENASLQNIHKLLYVASLKKKELNKKNKIKESNNILLKQNESMNSIYPSRNKKLFRKINELNIEDKIKNIDVSGQDTMQVLNKLAEQKEFLTQRMGNKLRKVNSLIEFKLPHLNNYESILSYVEHDKKNNSINIINKENTDNEKHILKSINDYTNNKIKIKSNMRKKILSLKNHINIINHKNKLFKKSFYENEQMSIYNKLKDSFNKTNNNIKDITENSCNSLMNSRNIKQNKSDFVT